MTDSPKPVDPPAQMPPVFSREEMDKAREHLRATRRKTLAAAAPRLEKFLEEWRRRAEKPQESKD